MNKYQEAFAVFKGIHISGEEAERMSTAELTTALAELELEGGERIDSLKSAVKGEAIHRLQHPLTWRLRRWLNRMKRHAHQV